MWAASAHGRSIAWRITCYASVHDEIMPDPTPPHPRAAGWYDSWDILCTKKRRYQIWHTLTGRRINRLPKYIYIYHPPHQKLTPPSSNTCLLKYGTRGVPRPKKKVVYHGDRLKYETQWVQCTPSISFIHVKTKPKCIKSMGNILY